MPVYEYRCKKCNKEFEYQQRMADAPRKKCEACGGALERLISMTSFQLKGSGWYKDLYGSTKPGAGGDGESGGDAAEPADGASSDAKADAKPDGKPDAKADAKGEAKVADKADKKAEAGKATAAKASDKPAAKPTGDKKPSRSSSKGK